MRSSHRKHSRFLGIIAFFLAFLCIFALFYGFSQKSTAKHLPTVKVDEFPTLIIDAGHGGEDGGATGFDGSLEKELNLQIAQRLYEALSSSGIPCVMTRKEDILLYDRTQDYKGRKKMLDMQARLNIASQYKDAIFISIHQNSFPVEKYSGFQVYYSQNDPDSSILARTLENAVRERLQPSNNRASKNAGDSIYLLKHLSCPAVLLECGFISNESECKSLSSEEYQKRLTEVLCDAIVEFINTRQTV